MKMETDLNKFRSLKYSHFAFNFQGLSFEFKLIDSEKWKNDKEESENFKITITNGERTITYIFHNSIMEKKISDYLNNLGYVGYNNRQFREWFKRFMWGGYDDVKNLKQLINKRCYYLAYGVLNDFATYINWIDSNRTFKEFCEMFGYNKDSREAEKIYRECLELYEKVESLKLSEKQEQYFLNEANQETNKFSKDVEKLFI